MSDNDMLSHYRNLNKQRLKSATLVEKSKLKEEHIHIDEKLLDLNNDLNESSANEEPIVEKEPVSDESTEYEKTDNIVENEESEIVEETETETELTSVDDNEAVSLDNPFSDDVSTIINTENLDEHIANSDFDESYYSDLDDVAFSDWSETSQDVDSSESDEEELSEDLQELFEDEEPEVLEDESEEQLYTKDELFDLLDEYMMTRGEMVVEGPVKNVVNSVMSSKEESKLDSNDKLKQRIKKGDKAIVSNMMVPINNVMGQKSVQNIDSALVSACRSLLSEATNNTDAVNGCLYAFLKGYCMFEGCELSKATVKLSGNIQQNELASSILDTLDGINTNLSYIKDMLARQDIYLSFLVGDRMGVLGRVVCDGKVTLPVMLEDFIEELKTVSEPVHSSMKQRAGRRAYEHGVRTGKYSK